MTDKEMIAKGIQGPIKITKEEFEIWARGPAVVQRGNPTSKIYSCGNGIVYSETTPHGISYFKNSDVSIEQCKMPD